MADAIGIVFAIGMVAVFGDASRSGEDGEKGEGGLSLSRIWEGERDGSMTPQPPSSAPDCDTRDAERDMEVGENGLQERCG